MDYQFINGSRACSVYLGYVVSSDRETGTVKSLGKLSPAKTSADRNNPDRKNNLRQQLGGGGGGGYYHNW